MPRAVSSPYLFEISWEVANKGGMGCIGADSDGWLVGGINTVLRSKVPVTEEEYGERYCLVGPYFAHRADLEVEEEEPKGFMAEALDAFREQGINYRYGKWLVDGAPSVLLLDTQSALGRIAEWRSDFWALTGIGCPESDREMNDAVLFGYLVAWFLGSFCHLQREHAVIAHFHEWQASLSLVLCRKRATDIALLFTTHATLLGRYLCAGDVDFYNHMRFFDVDLEAGKRGIYHRYCLERAAAHCADVFTTVSHITAYEAEFLLKRKPDGVLPNGINAITFSAMHEFQNLHQESKLKIQSFVEGHFYGHQNFDMENTLFFFTAGRYEYRNKGVDLFLESLARLNHRLRLYNSATTVVAFIIMPAPTNNYNVDALKGQAVTKKLKDVVESVTQKIGRRLYDQALQGNVTGDLLGAEDVVTLKRHINALKREHLPPVVTHNMQDSEQDLILGELRRLQLYNSPADRVKVVFHPEFLNVNNPVLGMEYEDFVRGCHLGVFPSYYEPWGYTPAECTVMGVPSVTTNLSGFGCFIEEHLEQPSDYGIYIVDRRMRSVEESVQQLTDYFVRFCKKTKRQRINMRNRTERLSELLDWKTMGLEYRKARLLVLKRVYPEAFVDEREEQEEPGLVALAELVMPETQSMRMVPEAPEVPRMRTGSQAPIRCPEPALPSPADSDDSFLKQ